jgi:hypothetical protein
MLYKSILSFFLSSVIAGSHCWEFVGEERLPGELRVVNEGLAHGEISTYCNIIY